ncbi:hypothetical protein [Desulfosediminicola flagellatus]|uniref:hypothetical protein n=1 Tax=Desulfosediminicola flagellatus TaxID=2569541 RepID=UPI0010AC6C99|nr:hypothetical protein [Desulfosediminicola flagellatus]
MESQDIFILLKIASLEEQEDENKKDFSKTLLRHKTHVEEESDIEIFARIGNDEISKDAGSSSTNHEWDELDFQPNGLIKKEDSWQGWLPDDADYANQEIFSEFTKSTKFASKYSVRGLSAALGISKTAVNNSLKRSLSVGLVYLDRKTKYPKVNRAIIYNFIIHAIKYVFPAELSSMTRGIPTSFSSPALNQIVVTAGEFIYVWPDPRGKKMGQSVTPLFPTVPFAVRKDKSLYEYLSLVDAIRIGNAREVKLAKEQLHLKLLLS